MSRKSSYVANSSACIEVLETRTFFSVASSASVTAASPTITTVSVGVPPPTSPATGTDFSALGPFKLGPKNQLETKTGKPVYGYQADCSGNIPRKNLKAIIIPIGQTFSRATRNATLIGTLNRAHPTTVTTFMTLYSHHGLAVNVSLLIDFSGSTSTGTAWKFHANLQNNAATPIGSGLLHFDKSGHLISATGNTLKIPQPGTNPTNSVRLDFSAVSISTSVGTAGNSFVVMSSQDGFPPGALNGFTVSPDGIVTGSYSNGATRTLWQIIHT